MKEIFCKENEEIMQLRCNWYKNTDELGEETEFGAYAGCLVHLLTIA